MNQARELWERYLQQCGREGNRKGRMEGRGGKFFPGDAYNKRPVRKQECRSEWRGLQKPGQLFNSGLDHKGHTWGPSASTALSEASRLIWTLQTVDWGHRFLRHHQCDWAESEARWVVPGRKGLELGTCTLCWIQPEGRGKHRACAQVSRLQHQRGPGDYSRHSC